MGKTNEADLMKRTKLELFLIVALALIAIGAMLMGMNTLNKMGAMEQALTTMANMTCGEKQATIDYSTFTLYCEGEGKITQIDLLTRTSGKNSKNQQDQPSD